MASKTFTIFSVDGTPAEVLVLLEDIEAGIVQVTLLLDPSQAIGDIAGFFTNLDGITVQNNFSSHAIDAEPGDSLTVGNTPGINTLFLDDSGSTTDALTDIAAEVNTLMGSPLPSYDLGLQIGTASLNPADDYQQVVFQLVGPGDFDSSDIKTVGVRLKNIGTSNGDRAGSQFLEGTVNPVATLANASVAGAQPSLNVTKEADVESITSVGDIINYTIQVENTGDVALTKVTVNDSLIPNLVLSGGDVDNDSELDVNETWRFTGSLTVTQDTVNASIGSALEESFAAAFSDAIFAFSNFSHSPATVRTSTDTDTLAVAGNGGTALAVAEANAAISDFASSESSQGEPDADRPVESDDRSEEQEIPSEGGDNPTTGANIISNETTVTGLNAAGLAQSDASVLGVFEINSGETFSFEFEGGLVLQTTVGNPLFSNAAADSLVFFEVLDDRSLEADPLDFLAIAGQVVNDPSDPSADVNGDFLDLDASDHIIFDDDETGGQIDFEGPEQSAVATVKGSYRKTFDTDTVVTLVEAKVGSAVAETDPQEGLPIVNTVTVDTDQTEPVTATTTVAVDIPPIIDVEIQTQVNGVDANTPQNAVELAPGGAIAWTYHVTNRGNVSLADLVVVDDNGTPEDASDDITPDFIGGDINQNNLLDPNEVWTYSTTGTAQNLFVSIDFDTDGTGSSLAAGEVIIDQYANLGLTVSTPVNPYGAMIFDSANPTGGDIDLGTPTQPDGPGIGTDAGAGIGNLAPQGHVLIISEDGDASDPDDNATGGTLRFDLNDPARFVGVNLLDIDLKERNVTVQVFEEEQLIQSIAAQNLGDNSFQSIDLDGVMGDRLDVNLVNSGAVTELNYVKILESTSTLSASFANQTVTVTDTSYYTNPI